jgi:hypothetical protein
VKGSTREAVRRPRPEVVISVLAIIAAVAGTAFAGPLASESVLSKKEKKQTKNITAGVLNQLAPGLSVAKAANASALGGVTESALTVSRSVYDEDCDPPNSSFFDCAPVTLSLPRAGRVMLFASGGQATNTADPVEAECRFEVDDSPGPVTGLNGVGTGENTDNTNSLQAENGVMYSATTEVLGAGTHSFLLSCAQSDSDLEIDDLTVTATMVGSS